MDPRYEGIRFCTECGAAIPNGSEFCYRCGAIAPPAPAPGSTISINQEYPETSTTTEQPQGTRIVFTQTPESVADSISRLIRVWGVVALILGVFSLISSQLLVDVYNEFYHESINMSQVLTESAFLLASGLSAFAGCILVRRLRKFAIAVICCGIAAATSFIGVGGFMGIMTTLIGFYMTFAVIRLKRAFHD